MILCDKCKCDATIRYINKKCEVLGCKYDLCDDCKTILSTMIREEIKNQDR